MQYMRVDQLCQRATTGKLPASCNRDDHLVRALVAAGCSALYLRTNLVSSLALGSHRVFPKLTSFSSPDGVYRSPTIR